VARETSTTTSLGLSSSSGDVANMLVLARQGGSDVGVGSVVSCHDGVVVVGGGGGDDLATGRTNSPSYL
jgi:hypothetical protein